MQDDHDKVTAALLRLAKDDMEDGKVLSAAVIWFVESQDGMPILRTLFSGQRQLRLSLLLSVLGREMGWQE